MIILTDQQKKSILKIVEQIIERERGIKVKIHLKDKRRVNIHEYETTN